MMLLIFLMNWIPIETCQSTTPIHCQWNNWVVGACSVTCGTGTRTNTRTKSVVEKDGGTCTGQPIEQEQCKIKECPGILI